MFHDTNQGATNYCSHTKDGTLCDKCRPLTAEERIIEEFDKDFENALKFACGDIYCDRFKSWLSSALKEYRQKIQKEFFDGYPMGVSLWRELGKKYKYWDYFQGEIRQSLLTEVRNGLPPEHIVVEIEAERVDIKLVRIGKEWNAYREAVLEIINKLI